MSLIGKPLDGKRTKFCFVYCGPERCDCGANLPHSIDLPNYPIHPHPKGGVEEKKDPFDDALDVVTEKKDVNS